MMETADDKKEQTISHEFDNLDSLKSAMMTFVRDGGIFIPTEEKFYLGEIVNATLTLPNDSQLYTFSGEVIWITPSSVRSGNQHAGIGIQCGTNEGEVFQKAANQLLVDTKDDITNTETM